MGYPLPVARKRNIFVTRGALLLRETRGVCRGEARENIVNGGARKKERETGMEIEIKRGTRSREITRRG